MSIASEGSIPAEGHLGLVFDPAVNAAGRSRISAAGSMCAAWVVPTDEDRVIARHARALLGVRK